MKNNSELYYNGTYLDFDGTDPNKLITREDSIIYGTDEHGNQVGLTLGENLQIKNGELDVVGEIGGVLDVTINNATILNSEKIANINLGSGLSFDISSNTLNTESISFENEHVVINLNVNEGTVNFSGETITVSYEGKKYTYNLDANGETEFDVAIGVSYIVKYPTIMGYYDVTDTSYVATKKDRLVIKTYQYYGDSVRMVLLEQSNPIDWVTSGPEAAVDNILNKYGTYVIDEVHKKYAKLDSEDHAYFDDGSIWNGSYGNSFRHLPEVFYFMDKDKNNQPLLKISFVDIGGHSWPECWIGTYKGSVINNQLRSIPDVATTQNTTMTNFWNAAQRNGSNYGLVNYFNHCMLVALHYAKFGTSNSVYTMGPGLQDAGQSYYTHQTGSCKALGDGTGSMPYLGSLTLTMNKLFGIEDLAGSTWEFRPNIRFSNNGSLATVYTGNTVSNTAVGRTFVKLNSANGDYIKNMVLGEYCDFIPSAIGGTSETYYCDATWASTSGELLLVGGNSNRGSVCGVSSAISYCAFSSSDASFGARLAFYGNIEDYTLVSGTELNNLNK